MARTVFGNLMNSIPSKTNINRNSGSDVHQHATTSLRSDLMHPTTLTSKSSNILDTSAGPLHSTSFFDSKSIVATTAHIAVLTTSAFHNDSATTPIPTTNVTPRANNLLLYIGVPVAVIGFLIVSCLLVMFWRWYKRRKQLERDFTPCYTYDQSENDITDGNGVYATAPDSVEVLCIASSAAADGRDVQDDDNDESCLLGGYSKTSNNEMDDIASNRCHSVSV